MPGGTSPRPPSERLERPPRASLSFVLPAFNEAANIDASIARCVRVGEELGLAFEILVVDDGSFDDTRSRADAWAARDRRVRTLHHPKNRGYGAALRSGLLAAAKERVFFTDADLQFDVSEVRSLLEQADRYDIVAGFRAPRRDPLHRRVAGAAWTRLVGLVFGLRVRDVDCAFKVFDRRVFDKIRIESLGAFVNTEILVRARAEGFTLAEVPVRHYPRTAGSPTGLRPRVILKAVSELLSLRAELRALPRPADQRSSSSA